MKPQDLLEKLKMTATNTEASTPVFKVHVHHHQYSRHDYVSTDGVWVYPGDIFDLVQYVEELEANLDYHRSFTQLPDPPLPAMACIPDLQVTQLQGIGGPLRKDNVSIAKPDYDPSIGHGLGVPHTDYCMKFYGKTHMGPCPPDHRG